MDAKQFRPPAYIVGPVHFEQRQFTEARRQQAAEIAARLAVSQQGEVAFGD